MAHETWALALCEACLTTWWVSGRWEWVDSQPDFVLAEHADISECAQCGSDEISVTGR